MTEEEFSNLEKQVEQANKQGMSTQVPEWNGENMNQQEHLKCYPELVAFIEKLHRSPKDVKEVSFCIDPPDSFVDQSMCYYLPVMPRHIIVTFFDGAKYLMEGAISYVPPREEEKAWK